MKRAGIHLFVAGSLIVAFLGCSKNEITSTAECTDDDFFCQYSSRAFQMGFSSWPYAPSEGSVSSTYRFLADHSDIYSEHIDSEIPWNAWIQDLPLPDRFVNSIASKRSARIPGSELTLSVSLLNNSRTDLAPDFDGTIPDYNEMNDASIEDAYVKHLTYIARELNPDYFLSSI